MKKEELEQLRQEYSKHSLDEKEVDKNPFNQFEKWLAEALRLLVPEPNAMTLSTADSQNRPHSRIVLLKGYTDQGFIFFTNYASDKGRELEQNPYAALCFFWIELERQVRIEGAVEKISQPESERYFQSRPYMSQIGALASNQSEVVESREALEKKFSELTEKYPEEKVEMPETWGGYLVKPSAFEFWQGRQSRLHDRIKYTKKNENWNIERLSP
ncbi:MAG: pyridoxamine 5'-phosphate oxidase [Balneolaceae bacterium]